MKPNLTLSLIAAAVLSATPVLAQTSTNSAAKGTNAASTAAKPLCSTLNHPNAGKLADKSTGMAKENSSSPVHQDCIPDSPASTAGTNSGSLTSSTNGMASTNGATAGNNAAAAASSTNSVTGSTSTVSPNIDLRGRSSVTIDNTTTTGDQSLTSSTNATTSTNDASSTNGTSSTNSTKKRTP